METKYRVLCGPHYPPAVQIESSADYCLVAQMGTALKVLLAYEAPARYKAGWRTRKKNEGKAMLERQAKTLNSKKTSAKAKKALLQNLAEVRVAQVNIVNALEVAKRTARRPAHNFRADFGNVRAGEREGSFSPPGRIDGYW